MVVKVIAFGVIKEMLNESAVAVTLSDNATMSNLKTLMESQYPRLKDLSSFMIAINNEYAKPDDELHENDEIALIPPVSGG